MSRQLYRVRWKSRITGSEGKSAPTTYKLAADWAAFANGNFPTIDHWIDPVQHKYN